MPLKGAGAKRATNEETILHAGIYRDVWLGKVKPAVTIGQMLEGPTVATYVVPSTEKAPDGDGPYRK